MSKSNLNIKKNILRHLTVLSAFFNNVICHKPRIGKKKVPFFVQIRISTLKLVVTFQLNYQDLNFLFTLSLLLMCWQHLQFEFHSVLNTLYTHSTNYVYTLASQ